MLRRNIGKSKVSNKKQNAQQPALPKSLWKFYFKYAVPGSWWALICYAVAFLAARSGSVLFPYCERWFIAIFEQPVPAGVNFVQFALPTILLIVGVNLFLSISAVLRGMFHARWSPQISNRSSVILNDYVHNQSMSFWTGRMAGQVNSQINYITNGFHAVQDFWRIFASLAFMTVSVGLIFQINMYVAIIFAIVFVLRAAYSWALIKPMSKASKDASSISSKLSGKIVDSISNFSVVKLFAGASRERKHLEPVRNQHIAARVWSFFVQRLFWGVPLVVWDICYGATLLFCVYLYMNGQITVSEIVFTVSIYFSTMNTISSIVDSIPDMTERISSASKAYAELVVPIAVQDAPDAATLNVTCGEIEFRNVSFKYKRKWVLQNFNLKIKCGERVGLVGASGACKTTLVNLLMRFYEPNKGQILIDGQDIKTITQDSLRENIAFIPQDPTMFNRTLRENIAYGKPGASDKEIRAAAKRAAADEFIMSTDKKYDSMVGDRGIKLSGGQRQRVAIARAFLKNAPILVLDEATSALDSETEVAIQKSFDELADGRTTIAIAHRLSTLRNMNKIVVMKDGHIIEQGSHNSLIKKRGEYARLWKMQSGGFLQD